MDLMQPQRDDHEAAMARADLFKCAQYSFKLFKMVHDGQQLEGWVQAKITKAADYIASVYHYMEYEMKFSEYGEQIENSDMYSESQKAILKNKLMEAHDKLKKLNQAQAKKKKAKEAELDEGWEDMMKYVADKEREEKGTGKFDKKKTSTGTVYTRKSSTFDDGGDDSDTKKAKKKAKASKTDEAVKKSDIPAFQRKAKGGDDWKVTTKDLDKEEHEGKISHSKTLAKNSGRAVEEAKKAKKDYDGDGKIESGKDEYLGSKIAAAKKAGKIKEASKPDFLDMDKDGNKKEPMKKAVADKKKNPFAKVKEASAKCNHSPKGKSCPVHGLKECGMYGEAQSPFPSRNAGTQAASQPAKKVQSVMPSRNTTEASKPSAGMSSGAKSALVKKAKAGGDIGKPGKSFDKVAKAAGGGEKGKKIAAAAMWKNAAK